VQDVDKKPSVYAGFASPFKPVQHIFPDLKSGSFGSVGSSPTAPTRSRISCKTALFLVDVRKPPASGALAAMRQQWTTKGPLPSPPRPHRASSAARGSRCRGLSLGPGGLRPYHPSSSFPSAGPRRRAPANMLPRGSAHPPNGQSFVYTEGAPGSFTATLVRWYRVGARTRASGCRAKDGTFAVLSADAD
jgi:hypothetical protein